MNPILFMALCVVALIVGDLYCRSVERLERTRNAFLAAQQRAADTETKRRLQASLDRDDAMAADEQHGWCSE